MDGGWRVIVGINMNATVRQRRLAAGITLQALAEKAQVSISMCQLIDRGYEPTTSPVRDRILAALDKLEHGERYVPFAEVADHLETGPAATDGPKAAA